MSVTLEGLTMTMTMTVPTGSRTTGVSTILLGAALVLLAASGCSAVLQWGEVAREPTCGDGIIDPNEACDGPELAGTTCETLGYTGGAIACAADCTLDASGCTSTCGDGQVGPDEGCDDGGFADGDGCSALCRPEVGYHCQGNPSVCTTLCGDAVRAGTELCDDGNNDSGDGCSADCTSDESCGNGIIDAAAGEACEDGNVVDWDGCSATCRITEFLVTTETAYDQMARDVAMAADGRAVITWESNHTTTGGQADIYAIYYAADGSVARADFAVNTTTADQQDHPAVGMTPDGRFVIAWESANQDTSGGGIYAQRYGADAQPRGGEFYVPYNFQNDQQWPSIAMTASGKFVVGFVSDYSTLGQNHVYAAHYFADGTPPTWNDQIANNFSLVQSRIAVSIGANDFMIAAWTENDGDSWGIWAQAWDTDGMIPENVFAVNTTTAGAQTQPQVAHAGNGTYIVVWQDGGGADGDRSGIFARRFEAFGDPLSAEIQVNTYTTGEQIAPDVAAGADGRFVVTWQSQDQDGDSFGIYAQRYDAGDNPVGGEFAVNTYTTSTQNVARVAMADDGRFIIVWTSIGPHEQEGVYAQRYDANGNAIGKQPW